MQTERPTTWRPAWWKKPEWAKRPEWFTDRRAIATVVGGALAIFAVAVVVMSYRLSSVPRITVNKQAPPANLVLERSAGMEGALAAATADGLKPKLEEFGRRIVENKTAIEALGKRVDEVDGRVKTIETIPTFKPDVYRDELQKKLGPISEELRLLKEKVARLENPQQRPAA